MLSILICLARKRLPVVWMAEAKYTLEVIYNCAVVEVYGNRGFRV